MSDNDAPTILPYREEEIREFATLRATLDAKDRLLERMADALRRAKGHVATNDRSRKKTRQEVLAQIRDALAEYADTAPKVLDPAPAPQ